MKRSDLIGIEVVINNVDEAKQFSRLCSDYGIYQGNWSCCDYTNGTMRGLVSLDKCTDYSCKLVFTNMAEDEDTMIEFCNLRKVDLYSLLQPEPQFHNGDTVYDENGVSYVYIGLHHKHDMTSVVYHLEAEEYIDVPNDELYSEKPVTPKDGEWWMCEVVTDEVTITRTGGNVLLYANGRWVRDRNYLDIKPLYRMIRDTNTDTE